MSTLYDSIVATLAPIVGRPAAEICIRCSAMELGKPAQSFTRDDLPTLEGNIRKSLAPFATQALLDSAIAAIRATAS